MAQGDSFHEHLAKVMSSFQPGLFAGGDEVDQIRDNLDLDALVLAQELSKNNLNNTVAFGT